MRVGRRAKFLRRWLSAIGRDGMAASDTAIHGAHGQMELLETGRYFTPEDYDSLGLAEETIIAIEINGVEFRRQTFAANELREAVFDLLLSAGDNLAVQVSGGVLGAITINGFAVGVGAGEAFNYARVGGINSYTLSAPAANDGVMQLRARTN